VDLHVNDIFSFSPDCILVILNNRLSTLTRISFSFLNVDCAGLARL